MSNWFEQGNETCPLCRGNITKETFQNELQNLISELIEEGINKFTYIDIETEEVVLILIPLNWIPDTTSNLDLGNIIENINSDFPEFSREELLNEINDFEDLVYSLNMVTLAL